MANSTLSDTGSTETVVKYVVYRLPTITAILFYWITIKVVQQLTGLAYRVGRPNGQTGELLDTTQDTGFFGQLAVITAVATDREMTVL